MEVEDSGVEVEDLKGGGGGSRKNKVGQEVEAAKRSGGRGWREGLLSSFRKHIIKNLACPSAYFYEANHPDKLARAI